MYSTIWTPVFGELLSCERELENTEDRYAVAIKDEDIIISHVPRKISYLCSVFIRRGGVICCIVNGDRRYSRHLPQGGMEVPCRLVFSGEEKDLNKVGKHLSDCKMKIVSRPACTHHVEKCMKSVDMKQELHDDLVDDNSESISHSTVCLN